MANAQLHLLPSRTRWTLDEDTKRIGRAGLAQARARLASVQAEDLMQPLEFDGSPRLDISETAFEQGALVDVQGALEDSEPALAA